MEPEVHIVEKYFQTFLHCFTMTNIRLKGGKEIDLLAMNPKTGEKYHVESRVGTSPGFKITLHDTYTRNGRAHRRGIDFFQKQKFNHPKVRNFVQDLFGDADYQKWLVAWHVQDSSVIEEAESKFGIKIVPISLMLDKMIREKKTKGSRDDILRTIELIAQMKVGTEGGEGKGLPERTAFEGKDTKSYHMWTQEDDIVTLYLYRFGDRDLPFSTDEIGEKLGMGVSSLRMRIANFKAIDGKGGLEHFGTQSLKIYKRYKQTPKSELKSLVLRILQKDDEP